MNIDLPPQYDPHAVEAPIYQKWLDAKSFHAIPDARTNKFSIVIPPPNVTGALHLGHAINGTIQDILTRYHRMKGDNTLWMPGIDHAGIATQAVVEKTIFEKEKKSRHDLGRDELVRRIWEWKEQYGTRILNQQAQLGASCDWDRTRFTLDETCAKAVREAFFKMFKDGLIFRGKRLVNWDTHLQTAVADDEIYHETVKGQLTSIKYPIAPDEPHQSEPRPLGSDTSSASEATRSLPDGRGSETEFLVVATTRPETMLGDTAVAVHPDDPRYKHLIGKSVIIPLVGRRIPIIADGLLVDPAFGTGVVKVTPAHDPNDYATGVRHNLEQINLLTPDGKVNEKGSGTFFGKEYSYVGLKFATAARKAVLADLEGLNLIAETKPHEHEVGHSDRSKTPIEPYLSDQWFIRMGDIVGDAPPSEPRPSGSDQLAPEPQTPHSNAMAYFLTFHTYATWLHGSEEGSINPQHNQYGTPFIAPDPKLLELKHGNSKNPPLEFSVAQRRSVLATIKEVAQHRGWTLHAVNVRSTHVHAVVAGNASPERMMNDFKSYATRRLRESSLVDVDTKIWSRHGSTPYLWKPEDIHEATQYAIYKQGPNIAETFFIKDNRSLPQSEPRPLGSDQVGIHVNRSLPHGRGSEPNPAAGITLANGQRAPGLAQAAMDAVTSGRVKITPDRYAKGYLDWLAQKRDWCISRQLWWGHRIPVWSRILVGEEWKTKGRPGWSQADTAMMNSSFAHATIQNRASDSAIRWDNQTLFFGIEDNFENESQLDCHIAVLEDHPNSKRLITELESVGFVRDPDVLDTWFSSALWPLSTMGWPSTTPPSEPRPSGSDRVGIHLDRSLPHGRGSENRIADGMPPEPGLLDYFYPTSVLSTARDILTLWVARMVIFGLYCHGQIPFKDVYIHAVIQDGEGRTMSKSKGNGVDPVDIINSHGADALRFTLASMATETQDIRMPVVKDPKTGTNTSPKFDIGRNFANKIWNASRYILTNIEENTPSLETRNLKLETLEDRWILSRLNTTIQTVESAITTFHFADVAESLRTFFWTDLCDWYLEIAKARLRAGDAAVQSILLHCLQTTLKLLHPLMPFISEELWSKLPHHQSMLITAEWPKPLSAFSIQHSEFSDAAAESQIATIQSITTAIREIQNRYPAAKGKPIVLQPRDAGTQQIIEHSRLIIESLTSAKIEENSPTAPKPENAAATILPDAGGVHIFIGNVIDKSIEIPKLTKRKAELEKLIPPTRNKLGNEAAIAKVPAAVVQGWRDQLAKYQEELATLEKNLAELQPPR